MDKHLQELFQSGKRLLLDTKTPKQAKAKTAAVKVKGAAAGGAAIDDPHTSFVRRCIRDKPSKKDVVEMFKTFIEAAEAKL